MSEPPTHCVDHICQGSVSGASPSDSFGEDDAQHDESAGQEGRHEVGDRERVARTPGDVPDPT